MATIFLSMILIIVLCGCGVQWVRPKPPKPKTPPVMMEITDAESFDTGSFGADLMDKTKEEVEQILGPPAKKEDMLDQVREAWYYEEPQKAKLYFRNGKVVWWNLTIPPEERSELGAAEVKKRKRENGGPGRHQRAAPFNAY